ncbi:MAG: phosphomannomutase/phosphoglucomutase [Oceanicoccus sp.]
MANNKSRNSKSSDSDESKAKPENKLRSTLINAAILSLLIVGAMFSYLALIERPAISKATIQAQAQSLADSQVSLIDQALSQLQLRLSSIAMSAELLAGLDLLDQNVVNRYRRELSRAFPEAVSTKLITLGPLGIASLNKESRELRNNIELDLLRYASNGIPAEPEAYKIDGKWLFSVAIPVKAEDKTYASGALLVTLDESYLLSLLGQLDSSLGQSRLIQQFKNKQHIIASNGNAGSSHLTVTADTSISHWQISFTPSAEMIAKSRNTASIVWIMLAVAISALILSAISANSTLKKALAWNLQNLTQPGKSKKPPYTLPGFEEVSLRFKEIQAAASKPIEPEPEMPIELVDPLMDIIKSGPLTLDELKDNEPEEEFVLPDVLPDTIFRAYDIRGLAESELTDQTVYAIAMAIGSEAQAQGQQSVIVSADGRHSSPRIRKAMIAGLQASGADVIDIGTQPTPLMYFATHQLSTQSGVMITGSHNPAEYNGIKVVINQKALSGAAIQSLKERILNNDLASGSGEYQSQLIDQSYIDYIINDVAIAQPLKIVIDAGNGVTGPIAPRLFEELGCEIIPLYCDVDGDFPNHHPDPTVEANLEDLKRAVSEHKADLGIAFDGDGDRLGVVTASGKSVPADRLLMLLAQDVVSRNPGADVIFDVKCSRNLNNLISNYGGRPIMWKSGHSFMKEKMAETGALLGGEFSGHIFFKERWFGFDDGMYSAARLVEILSTTDPDLDLQLEAFPQSIGSPELKIESSESQKFAVIEQLINTGNFDDGKLSTLDGLRVDYPDGWGLVRASNTTPMLVLRFEADTEQAMERIQHLFKEQLSAVDNSLHFDF